MQYNAVKRVFIIFIGALKIIYVILIQLNFFFQICVHNSVHSNGSYFKLLVDVKTSLNASAMRCTLPWLTLQTLILPLFNI